MDELNINFIEKIIINTEDFSEANDKIASITKFDNTQNIDLSAFDIAILGTTTLNTHEETNKIRHELYDLYKPQNINIIDIGNIRVKTKKDFYKLYQTINILNEKKLKTILISNNELINIPIYHLYKKKQIKFNALSVDSQIDIRELDEIQSTSYLNYFKTKHRQFNKFNIIGYQKYLVNSKHLEAANKLGINAIRLGKIKKEITEYEPLFRDAHIINIDFTSVKSSNSMGSKQPSPNGFSGNEICKLSFFGGLSDSSEFFTINEIYLQNDINNQTAKLVAQSIWHYIDACSIKINATKDSKNNYQEYILKLEIDKDKIKEIIFIRCVNTGRWWLKPTNNSLPLEPCTRTDYEKAKSNIISENIANYINKIKNDTIL